MHLDGPDGSTPIGNGNDGWPRALSYWRTYAAESFDDAARGKSPNASAARRQGFRNGRRPSAVRHRPPAASPCVGSPARIGARVDLVMTTLLHCALENAAVAEVLAHALQRMPIAPRERARIAASWLVHRIWLSGRRRNIAPRRPKHHSEDGGAA